MGDAHIATLGTTTYFSPVRINFRQCADDIKESAGITYVDQARLIGKEWSTVQRWHNGAQPGHADAEMFLTLHSHACGPALTEQRRAEALTLSLTAPSM